MKHQERLNQLVDSIKSNLLNSFGKTVQEATKAQIYMACAQTAREEIMIRYLKSREAQSALQEEQS